MYDVCICSSRLGCQLLCPCFTLRQTFCFRDRLYKLLVKQLAREGLFLIIIKIKMFKSAQIGTLTKYCIISVNLGSDLIYKILVM